MDDELLRSIIALEKLIQQQLAEEQRRASVWLEREREAERLRLERCRTRLSVEENRKLKAARNRLLQRVERWEKNELARLERFQRMVDDRLERSLADLLSELLPGVTNDHQDVEG